MFGAHDLDNDRLDFDQGPQLSTTRPPCQTAMMGKRSSRPQPLPPYHESDNRSLQQFNTRGFDTQGFNTQASNTQISNTPSTDLPPEIFDEILKHVPAERGNRQTLIACALVAARWTGPSQRRLFSSVEIYGSNYHRWMYGFLPSGSKDRLLGHVRSLRCARRVGYRMRDLPRDFGEYLSALPNLRSLALCYMKVEHFSGEEFHVCFSAFRGTLTSLSLDSVTAPLNTFVTLLGYFPNITTLRLDTFVLEPDERPIPSLARSLRGKLHVRDIDDRRSMAIDRFAKLNLEYEELVINFPPRYYMEVMKRVLRISTSTVKSLKLTGELYRE